MQREFGWRRSVLSGAFSVALLVAAVVSIPVGRWLDRHSPRALMTIGAVVASALVAAWGSTKTPEIFYVVWVTLGACMAILFYEPAFTVLTKRFKGPERHRAITSVTLLAGLASTIFGPLTAALERSFGWRGAALVLAGLLAAITVPLFSTALKPMPPASADLVAPIEGLQTDSAPRETLASAQFWYLTGAYLLSGIISFAIAVHLVPYLRDEGWSSGTAAAALGGIGLMQVLGRTTFTRLSARIPAAQLGTWAFAAKGVGLAALLLVPGVAGVATCVAIYGAANGLTPLTRATVVADLYGVAHYGSISAVVSAVGAVGGSVAPFAVALAVDYAGNDFALWSLVGLSGLSALANRFAGSSRWQPTG